MMKKYGLPIEVIEKEGVMLPIVSVEARYKMPAKMGDVIRIVSKINKVPMAKLEVLSEIYNQDGVLLCTGKVVLGFIDAVTRHPVRCPQNLADIISAHIDE